MKMKKIYPLILEKSNEFINIKENIYLMKLKYLEKILQNLNCKRHFKVFINLILYQNTVLIVIKLRLIDKIILIKLYLIFDSILLENNNIRKCAVETRKNIKGNYKGYIYCKGLKKLKRLNK